MNYKRIYSEIIERAKHRSIDHNEYYENHHIVPKSLGGSNNKDNLSKLTAREHYIAHWLLAKIYENVNENGAKYKMASAFNVMNNISNTNCKRYISSRGFEAMRKLWIKNHQMRNPEVKKKVRETTLKNNKPRTPPSEEARKNMSDAAKKNLSCMTPEELSDRMKKSVGTADHILRGKKVSESKRGKKTNQVQIEIEKYGKMTDDEFQAHTNGRNTRMTTRMTNRRNRYVPRE